MKVLFVSHQASFIYGGEVCTLAFMEELKRSGVSVEFASPPGPYFEEARARVPAHPISSVQFRRALGSLPSLARGLWKTRTELGDLSRGALVHATSLKAMVYAAALPKKRPVLWHHHDILPAGFTNRLWLRALAARAARIVVPSHAAREALLAAGIDSEKCRVVENGFELGRWRMRAPRTDAAKFRIGLVGEISPRKGHDRLAAILAELRRGEGAAGVEVVVVGDSVSDPGFGRRMREELRDEPVSFLGRRKDIPEILQNLDLLLVPSRQDPLPTVIIEAYLSGVPVVGSPVGGIPEMVEEGATGYLARSDGEWAAAIARARDPGTWKNLSAGARRFAEAHYDLRTQTAKLRAIYEQIFSQP